MHRFKVGQKVVAIRNHSGGEFKKGDEFIVDGLTCCGVCGEPRVNLLGRDQICTMSCTVGQYHEIRHIREQYDQSSFAPLQNNADAIEYRLNVSIKELEVKEYQNP